MNDKTCSVAPLKLVGAAFETIASLDKAVLSVPPDAPVQTSPLALAGLSALIRKLANEVSACGGSDCMGRKIDGLRLWVTMDRLAASQAEVAVLRGECERHRDALGRIAAGNVIDDADRFFGDSDTALQKIRAFARAAMQV